MNSEIGPNKCHPAWLLLFMAKFNGLETSTVKAITPDKSFKVEGTEL